MTIIDNLQWRYATKAFDGSKAVAEEDLNFILEAGRLAPTSYGLQPFKILVVTDKNKKQALVEHAYGQIHVGTNSALIVIGARTDIDASYITEYTTRIETVRGLPSGAVDGYKDMMIGHLTNLTPEARLIWAQKQAYIALGAMVAAAAEKHIDSCPMEGFDAGKFNEVLGLTAHNLHATVILPIGYRAESDETQHYTKVRKEMKDMVVTL